MILVSLLLFLFKGEGGWGECESNVFMSPQQSLLLVIEGEAELGVNGVILLISALLSGELAKVE